MTARRHNLLIIIGILILSFSLHVIKINQDGFGNHYYAAAVKNMLSSPSNFFFASFDSQGFVTVDKPPAGLWIQSLFILVFGFNSFTVMLPSILAGILSVFLIFLIVRKTFGETAGLFSAFFLAITPIFVAVSRNNTMDAILIVILLFAVWLFQKGLESKKTKYFLFSAAVVGFAFNIKMMQAFVILPALFIVFLIYHKPKLPKKILQTALITIVLVAVSLSWAFVVELTPEAKRPFIGSSPTNSALDLMINYNGLDRVRAYEDPTLTQRQNYYETGKPGLLRLFSKELGGQQGWFILFAVFGSILYFINLLKAKEEHSKEAHAKEKRDLLFWATWFVVVGSYLSFNTGFFHIYYCIMLSPALAALGGIAVIGCLNALKSDSPLKWFVPGVLAAATFSQWLLTRPFSQWSSIIAVIMLIIAVLSAGFVLFLLARNRWKQALLPLFFSGILGLSILPVAWCLTPILYGGDPVLPYASPSLKDTKMGLDVFKVVYRDKSEYEKLLTFLEKNRVGEDFLVGVESAQKDGSNLALITDGDIMLLGGFSGGDPLLSADEIAAMTAEGKIRYFLVTMTGGLLNKATAWVIQNGKVVLNKEWKPDNNFAGYMLYDCKR